VDGALAEFAAVEAKARARLLQDEPPAAASHPKSKSISLAITASPEDDTESSSILSTLAFPDAHLQKSLTGAELGALAVTLHSGGRGVTRDVPRATRLWVFAASKNHLPSVLAVALASCDGLGVIPRDWDRAEMLLSKLSSPELTGAIPAAKFALATLLLKKLLVAAASAAAAARENKSEVVVGASTGALFKLSGLPTHLRVSPMATRALLLLRESSEGLLPKTIPGADIVGDDGDGGAARRHPGATTTTTTRTKGMPPALLSLANCLLEGVGTHEGEVRAEEGWAVMEVAARSGDPLAAAAWASHLDDIAATIPGGGKSSSSSRPFWRLAAEGGHPVAMHNVGVEYCGGLEGGVKDWAAAKIWFKRSGDMGYWPARVNLGLLLMREGDVDGSERELCMVEQVLMGRGGEALRATQSLLATVRRNRSRRRAAEEVEGGENHSQSEEGESGDLAFFFPSKEDRDKAMEELTSAGEVTQSSVMELVQKYQDKAKIGLL